MQKFFITVFFFGKIISNAFGQDTLIYKRVDLDVSKAIGNSQIIKVIKNSNGSIEYVGNFRIQETDSILYITDLYPEIGRMELMKNVIDTNLEVIGQLHYGLYSKMSNNSYYLKQDGSCFIISNMNGIYDFFGLFKCIQQVRIDTFRTKGRVMVEKNWFMLSGEVFYSEKATYVKDKLRAVTIYTPGYGGGYWGNKSVKELNFKYSKGYLVKIVINFDDGRLIKSYRQKKRTPNSLLLVGKKNSDIRYQISTNPEFNLDDLVTLKHNPFGIQTIPIEMNLKEWLTF